MFAAAHLDNLLIPLFFGIAILFQLLSAAATKKRKQRDDPRRRSTSPSQTARPLTTDADETDEERVRKFLEALGQPTTSKPPPPAVPRPTYQKPIVVARKEPEPVRRRSVLSPLPPLTTRPPEPEPQWQPPTQIVSESPPPPEPVPVIHAAASEASDIMTLPISQSAAVKNDFATQLRSTSGLRNAIILREVFGPPRSMQPLDLVGSV